MSLEEAVRDLQAYGIALDLLVAQITPSITRYGVRLRPFAKKLPREVMILAAGDTFEEAAQAAVGKAEDGRWETLAWASRPWDTADDGPGSKKFGL